MQMTQTQLRALTELVCVGTLTFRKGSRGRYRNLLRALHRQDPRLMSHSRSSNEEQFTITTYGRDVAKAFGGEHDNHAPVGELVRIARVALGEQP